jgi:hypothetical protein
MTSIEPDGQFGLLTAPCASLAMLLVSVVVGAVVAAFNGAPPRSPVVAGGIGGILGGWMGFLAIWDVILLRNGRLKAEPDKIWAISFLGALVGSLVLSTLAARLEKGTLIKRYWNSGWIKQNPKKSVVLFALLIWWLMPINWHSLEGHGKLYCFLHAGWPRRVSEDMNERAFNTWFYGNPVHHSIDFYNGICRSVFEETRSGGIRLSANNRPPTAWEAIKQLVLGMGQPVYRGIGGLPPESGPQH